MRGWVGGTDLGEVEEELCHILLVLRKTKAREVKSLLDCVSLLGEGVGGEEAVED